MNVIFPFCRYIVESTRKESLKLKCMVSKHKYKQLANIVLINHHGTLDQRCSAISIFRIVRSHSVRIDCEHFAITSIYDRVYLKQYLPFTISLKTHLLFIVAITGNFFTSLSSKRSLKLEHISVRSHCVCDRKNVIKKFSYDSVIATVAEWRRGVVMSCNQWPTTITSLMLYACDLMNILITIRASRTLQSACIKINGRLFT